MADFHFGVSQEQRDGISDKAPCYNSLAPCTLTPVLQTCHKERGSVLLWNVVITLFFHCSSGKIPLHQIPFRDGQTLQTAGIPAPTTENTIWAEPGAWPHLKSVPSPYLGVHNSVFRDTGGTKAAIPFSIYLWTWCPWRWLILFETYWHHLLTHTALATNFRSSQPTVKRVTFFNLYDICILVTAIDIIKAVERQHSPNYLANPKYFKQKIRFHSLSFFFFFPSKRSSLIYL